MQVLGYSYGITNALLNKLKELYPDRLPTDRITPEDLAYLQGQQSIISKLEVLQTEEKEF